MWKYIVCIILLIVLVYGGYTWFNKEEFSNTPQTCTELGCTDATMNPYFNRRATDIFAKPSFASESLNLARSGSRAIVNPLPVQVGNIEVKLQPRASGKLNPFALPVNVGERSIVYQQVGRDGSLNPMPLPVEFGQRTYTKGIVGNDGKVTGVLPINIGRRQSVAAYPTSGDGKVSGVLPINIGQRSIRVQRTYADVKDASPLAVQRGSTRPLYTSTYEPRSSSEPLPVRYGPNAQLAPTPKDFLPKPVPLGVQMGQRNGVDMTGYPSLPDPVPLPVGVRQEPQPNYPTDSSFEKIGPLPVRVGDRFTVRKSKRQWNERPNRRENFTPEGKDPARSARNRFANPQFLNANQREARAAIEAKLRKLIPQKLDSTQYQNIADQTLTKDALMTWDRDPKTKASLNHSGVVPTGVKLAYDKKNTQPYLELNRKTWGWGQNSFLY